MESNDIKRLALVLSCSTEVEAMKVDNKIEDIYGRDPKWKPEDFTVKAEELKNLAYVHDMQLFG